MLLIDAEIANGPGAAREARHAVADLSAQIPAGTASDVTLLVSELVTNSYRHAGMGREDSIRLRVSKTEGSLRVEVLDRGGRGSPALREHTDEGGWGLHIVEKLADRWGMTRGPAGTTVWFEMLVS